MATHENPLTDWTFFSEPLVPNQWPNAAHVNKEPTVQSEAQVLTVNPVPMANQAAMAPQAKMLPQTQKCCPHQSSAHVRTNPAQADLRDPKDHPDQLELLVPQVAMEVLVALDQSDPLDPKVPTAKPALRENPVQMDHQAHQLQDPLDNPVPMERTVHQALPVMQERTERLVPTERPVTMDLAERLEKLVPMEAKANPDPTDHQDPRDLATNVLLPVWLQDIKTKAHPHEITSNYKLAVGLMFTFSSIRIGFL